SVSGELSTDYTINLETRWPERLLSLGKRTAVSIASVNPPALTATTNAFFGTAYFGTSYFGGTATTSGSGSSGGVVSGDIVGSLDERQGYTFAPHGASETMIDPSPWPPISSDPLPSIILASVVWYNNGSLALGASTPVYVRAVNPLTAVVAYLPNH